MAFTQPGDIGIFIDPAGTSCSLTMATTIVYVIHQNTTAASASQWAIKAPLGLTHNATVAGPGCLLLGDAVNGAGVSYGECKAGPIYIAMVIYSATPGPGPCELITIQGDPGGNPPGIYMADCTSPNPVQFQIACGGGAIFNDGSCPCGSLPCVDEENTTWGRVKALFQ
jgi:hypothetical protein